ncbi:hypothetical protein CTheo_7480 [Ceratobasidium theobromae]|uniref:Uncharacterized protein n=1 Tax=Ceratobasidium theobromae TaxID=1582974 RepID=A0A5N5QCC0_9AGAM|nr:hypothetical protein CTheo_7480 [Ceratobasidium theobromae]
MFMRVQNTREHAVPRSMKITVEINMAARPESDAIITGKWVEEAADGTVLGRANIIQLTHAISSRGEGQQWGDGADSNVK